MSARSDLRMPSTDAGICERKLRYKGKSVAKNAAARGLNDRGVKLYVYECASCRGWHLTHVDPAKHREDARRRA